LTTRSNGATPIKPDETGGRHGEAKVIRTGLKALRRAIEMALQRVADVLGRLTRGMTLGVRALVIGSDGRVFLVKHSYVGGWHLPGGGVEPGETLIDALIRELREEGNLEPTAPPLLHGMFFNDSLSPRNHVAVYVVREFRQIGPPVPDFEIIAHGFFALDALPNDTTAATRARIIEVVGGAPVTERW
jgi:8-oxo-dGTP pyrophosphatase MutT (NUDIX family)